MSYTQNMGSCSDRRSPRMVAVEEQVSDPLEVANARKAEAAEVPQQFEWDDRDGEADIHPKCPD